LIHQEKTKGHQFTTAAEDQDHIGDSSSSSLEEEEEEEHVPSFKKTERKK